MDLQELYHLFTAIPFVCRCSFKLDYFKVRVHCYSFPQLRNGLAKYMGFVVYRHPTDHVITISTTKSCNTGNYIVASVQDTALRA